VGWTTLAEMKTIRQWKQRRTLAGKMNDRRTTKNDDAKKEHNELMKRQTREQGTKT